MKDRLDEMTHAEEGLYSQKYFDGDENIRETEETLIESWDIDDPNIPEWLRQYI